MNSHASSSFLLTTIIIFVTLKAVIGPPIVSPPAKIAGHNGESVFFVTEFEGAKITVPIAVFTTPSNTITSAVSQIVVQCCDPKPTVPEVKEYDLCQLCQQMCHSGAMDARHDSHLLREVCRCHAVGPCLLISFSINKTLYDGANHAPKNDGNRDNVPTVLYGTYAKTEWYQFTFLVLTIISCLLMVVTAFVYHFSNNRQHSRYVENVAISVVTSTYIAYIAETIRQSNIADFNSTGIYKLLIIINAHGWQLATNIELYNILKCIGNVSKFNKRISKRIAFHKFYWIFQLINISVTFCCTDIFHQVDESTINLFRNNEILGLKLPNNLSILCSLIPGLVNFIVFIYLFKYNEIQMSSIHPDLLNFYEKRIATRNLMFKLSVLMFVVDVLYVLDITMEWDFAVIHILHLLKSAQGIFISYIILFRPFGPILYNKLMKRLRRREVSANEETDNPIYTITTV